MSLKFNVGDRVYHNYSLGHGLGTVVGFNDVPASCGSFYNMERYPYRVRFHNGYEDVYADTDLIAESDFNQTIKELS